MPHLLQGFTTASEVIWSQTWEMTFFVKFLTATEKNPPVTHTVPGEGVQGDYYDEFHVDQDGLQDLIYSVFYKEDK